ncbi:hypothetical protein GJ744_002207 [Endocarpon pusillum]|uniref:Protein kinase domain-containing protein n=1 Tax=Endocarpon pusillum TaxID=364733 RepID=A0A8H7AFY4_9EURO|nr:hypothetical protein GJ744_002207 [Endocarpon pusillum]
MSSTLSSPQNAFAFQSSAWDLIASFADSSLLNASEHFGAPIVDDVVTFAQQLQATGLAICSTDDLEDINAGEPIGYGTTMTVFKCRWKSRKKVVAVKRINLGVPLGKSMLEIHEEEYQELLKSLFRELRVMNHPWFKAHPNFVDLLGVSWDRVEGDLAISTQRPSIIVEIADQTTPTLKDFISWYKRPWSDEHQQLVFDLLTDTAEAVAMLHATKMVHGDLKPENILLFPAPRRLVAKLSDFGFCSPFIENRERIGGTLYWNAPECMLEAPPAIKPFAKTMTRDLYSYGLVMWYALFLDMPYGPESSANESVIRDWKLNQGTTSLLRKHIITHATGLSELNSPLIEHLKDNSTPHDMLWFQIWTAMAELLRTQPNQRDVSLGTMHRVLQTPNSKAEIFLPYLVRPTTGHVLSRVDNRSGIALIRPSHVAGMSEATKNELVSKYDAYSLSRIPIPLQRLLFQTWEESKNSTSKSAPQYPDLAMIVASCHRIGFGVQRDVAIARELELEAARFGSLLGQMTALVHSLLDGTSLPIPAKEKVAWLKSALYAMCFQGHKGPSATAVQDRFRAAIDAVPDEFVEVSLLHSFIGTCMTEWEVLNGEFDGAAGDPLFGLVVKGDVEGLTATLSVHRALLQRRKDGYTLLHVAVDYCHEQIIRELIQKFSVSPNVLSDCGTTPIEMAALTGSIECLRLLLSLGAGPRPLAEQDLFTTVAMTGARESAQCSPTANIRTLLSLICGAVESNHLDESTPGKEAQDVTAAMAVQNLLDGRYGVKVDDLAACGSPLELCISVSNYTSVFSLLSLGADPNAFNHHLPPLHVAVSLREPVLAALLMAYGADPNGRARGDYDQDTPLHQVDTTSITAFYDPPRNRVTTYAEHVADAVKAVDTESNAAVAARAKACIAVLLFGGADIEARDAKGYTPFRRRVVDGDLGTAEYLISQGAESEDCQFRDQQDCIGEEDAPS